MSEADYQTAQVAYENANRFESASNLYERLVKEHPKSPLADSALFRVGLNAERFFDFDKAIASYQSLVKQYPKSERRADAIYNPRKNGRAGGDGRNGTTNWLIEANEGYGVD
ncbi:MAG: tetratricopeptide repeat protein, partial [Acidihalobacter sp.]